MTACHDYQGKKHPSKIRDFLFLVTLNNIDQLQRSGSYIWSRSIEWKWFMLQSFQK